MSGNGSSAGVEDGRGVGTFTNQQKLFVYYVTGIVAFLGVVDYGQDEFSFISDMLECHTILYCFVYKIHIRVCK